MDSTAKAAKIWGMSVKVNHEIRKRVRGDLAARAVGIKVLRPTQPNRPYDIVARKLRRSPEDEIDGWDRPECANQRPRRGSF